MGFFQNIIDIVRGKKVIKIVDKKKRKKKLIIPQEYKDRAFYVNPKKNKIFTKSYDVLCSIMEYNKNKDIPIFYERRSSWFLKDIFKDRYDNQLKFVEEEYLPHVTKEDILCDIGSASGEFTFILAKHCKQIDGYEISQKMVDFSINYAKENNITNADFYRADIQKDKIEKVYDNVSMMGVLSYVLDENVAKNCIKKLKMLLKSNEGGIIVYKDNCNFSDENYYFLGPSKDYRMVARSKDKIINMFKECGFEIVAQKILHKVELHCPDLNTSIETASLGLVLKKQT